MVMPTALDQGGEAESTHEVVDAPTGGHHHPKTAKVTGCLLSGTFAANMSEIEVPSSAERDPEPFREQSSPDEPAASEIAES